MEMIEAFVGQVNSIVWGVPMLILIGATGVFLMAGLLFMPLRKLAHGFKLLLTPARKSVV